MHARKNILTSMALATGLAMTGGAAMAATVVDPWTESSSGNISVLFGDNELGVDGAASVPGETTTTHSYDAVSGDFTDTFSFELRDGILVFQLGSTGTAAINSIFLTSVKFNGQDIAFTNIPGTNGSNSFSFLSSSFNIVEGGPQLLEIKGKGGAAAVLSGTASFAPAAIPEPGAWALMILGFAGTGALLRRRQAMLAVA